MRLFQMRGCWMFTSHDQTGSRCSRSSLSNVTSLSDRGGHAGLYTCIRVYTYTYLGTCVYVVVEPVGRSIHHARRLLRKVVYTRVYTCIVTWDFYDGTGFIKVLCVASIGFTKASLSIYS